MIGHAVKQLGWEPIEMPAGCNGYRLFNIAARRRASQSGQGREDRPPPTLSDQLGLAIKHIDQT